MKKTSEEILRDTRLLGMYRRLSRITEQMAKGFSAEEPLKKFKEEVISVAKDQYGFADEDLRWVNRAVEFLESSNEAQKEEVEESMEDQISNTLGQVAQNLDQLIGKLEVEQKVFDKEIQSNVEKAEKSMPNLIEAYKDTKFAKGIKALWENLKKAVNYIKNYQQRERLFTGEGRDIMKEYKSPVSEFLSEHKSGFPHKGHESTLPEAIESETQFIQSVVEQLKDDFEIGNLDALIKECQQNKNTINSKIMMRGEMGVDKHWGEGNYETGKATIESYGEAVKNLETAVNEYKHESDQSLDL